MSVTDELLANADRYAEQFDKGDLPLPPAKKVAVVACMDARLDPQKVLGLGEGDAHVIRNAGGVVTDDEIRSLAISQTLLGTEEIILIHHTDCGMLTFTDEQFSEKLEAETGAAARVGGRTASTTSRATCASRSRDPLEPVHPEQGLDPRLRLRREDRPPQRDRVSKGRPEDSSCASRSSSWWQFTWRAEGPPRSIGRRLARRSSPPACLSRRPAAQWWGRCSRRRRVSNEGARIARAGPRTRRRSAARAALPSAVQEHGEGDREEDHVQQQRLFARSGSPRRGSRRTRSSARPRGPNQPRKATVGGLARRSEHRQGDRDHPHHGQAEQGIDDAPRTVRSSSTGHEHDGAEEDERDCAEQAARLLEEERHLAADLPPQPSEDGAADEGGDEPAAAHPHGQPVGERGRRRPARPEPDRIDQARAARRP